MTRITNRTALTDQVRAASTEAHRTLARAAAATGGRLAESACPSVWYADQVRTLLDAIRSGTARACLHVTQGGPRIVHAAAWLPGMVTCSDCARLLALHAGRDDVCDRCDRQGRTQPGTIAVGPILLGYGLCPECRADASDGQGEGR